MNLFTNEEIMLTEMQAGQARDWTMGNVRTMPFCVLLCAALYANFLVVAGHDRQRILEIAVLLVGAVMDLVRRRLKLRLLFEGPAGICLATFFALGITSGTMAFSPRFALFEVAALFLLYLLATQVGDEVVRRGPVALRLILQTTAATVVLYSVYFLVAYVSAFCLGNPLTPDDFAWGFSKFRFFNHVQTSILPLFVLLCCLTARTDRLRPLWLGVTIYWWTALIATTGRGTLVGIAMGCTIIAIVLRRTAIPYLRMAALTAALGLVTYFILLVAVPAVLGAQGMGAISFVVERTANDPASGRMFLWRRAADLITQHPLLGVGPMHFAHYAGDLHIGAHPHDWLMQFGSEWGLPALACLLATIVLALRALLHAGRKIAEGDVANQTIFAALLMGAVAILVDGLVSGLFVMPQSQLAIALYLGCAIGWYKTVLPAPCPAAPNIVGRVGGALLVVAAMAGVAGVWQDVVARYEQQPLTAAQEAANQGQHWPRLWITGYF
jgi:O-antigen ligase